MKVLEKGTGQRGWSGEFVCTGARNGGGGCGARLLVEEPDLTPCAINGSYREDGDDAVEFRCCECGTQSVIPAPGVVIRRVHRAEKNK